MHVGLKTTRLNLGIQKLKFSKKLYTQRFTRKKMFASPQNTP